MAEIFNICQVCGKENISDGEMVSSIPGFAKHIGESSAGRFPCGGTVYIFGKLHSTDTADAQPPSPAPQELS